MIGHSPRGYGVDASFNPGIPDGAANGGEVSLWHYALNQGQIVLEAVRHLENMIGHSPRGFSFLASFNPGFPDGAANGGCVSPWHYALNQGPIVLIIENHRSGMIWNLMRRCSAIRTGLERAGFTGGWLDDASDGTAPEE